MIALTRREYDLIATLMGSHQALSVNSQLLERVWKYELLKQMLLTFIFAIFVVKLI